MQRHEKRVWEREKFRCEHCQLFQGHDSIPFEIDPIIAESHGGPTKASNLALACFLCNSYKGPNLSGIDAKTRRITRLFHPRRHKWKETFRWIGPKLIGKTATGRATIAVLRINLAHRLAHRMVLSEEGVFPPIIS